jgi:hypothetical protein
MPFGCRPLTDNGRSFVLEVWPPGARNARGDWSSVTRRGNIGSASWSAATVHPPLPNLQHQYLHQIFPIRSSTLTSTVRPEAMIRNLAFLNSREADRSEVLQREVSIDHDLNYDRILKVVSFKGCPRDSFNPVGRWKQGTLPTILRCWKRTHSRNLAILCQQPIASVEAHL